MQKEELVYIINQLQNYQCDMQIIEVKAAHTGYPTRLYDSLSSFSNQDGGGVIIFGVDENRMFAVVGVYNPQDLMHRVLEQCKQMQPAVRPLFTVCDLGGKVVVSAEIPGVDVADRPVYYMGTGRLKGSFIRVDAVDEPMSDYEIYSYDAYHRRIRDDIRINENATMSQMDTEKINKYLSVVKEDKPNLSQFNDNEILQLMGIMKDTIPTLAGILCFSKYPQAVFPQLCITVVVLQGTEIGQTGADGERFLANKRIEGPIEQMLDDTMLFVQKNMNVNTIIDKDGKRNDKYEYPLPAIREAVQNALIHRDYSIHTEGTPVRIIMYNGRMEIINSGGLCGTLTFNRFGKVPADTRNQTLMNILEILNLAENRYSGIPVIRMAMQSANLPAPKFENKRGTFIVTLENGSRIKGSRVFDKRVSAKAFNKRRTIGEALLEFCVTPRSREEIIGFVGMTRSYTMKTIVRPLVEAGKLKVTIPDNPKSQSQKYLRVQ